MIEYLEGLLEEGNHEKKVLELAEEQLRSRTNTPHQILALQTAILRANVNLGQNDMALTPGQVAVALGYELKEWDYFGTACLFLGTAYAELTQYEQSCVYFMRYIDRLPEFDKALRYQTPVWYNLGLVRLSMNMTHEASTAFDMAARCLSRTKTDRGVHGMRQALIFQYFRTGELAKVPPLLIRCSSYLRDNKTERNLKSLLFHIESRSRYALNTGRLHRAQAVALHGLNEAEGDNRHLTALHLMLARVSHNSGSGGNCVDHALAARFFARRSNRTDLEEEVNRFFHEDSIVPPLENG